MTPHNEGKKKDFAEVVIMPGDPLRAKYIAENFLDDYELVTDVRNMLGFTGHYKGKKVSVMASGMGIPSMAIYSYELFKFYNVKKIIRVGSCGSYKEDIKLRDLILVDKSVTDSSFAMAYANKNENVIEGSTDLNLKILDTAKKNNINVRYGNIYSTEAFYTLTDTISKRAIDNDCLAAEMESFALFYVAKSLGLEAACLLTVSDSKVTDEKLSSEQREESLNEMIELALESI